MLQGFALATGSGVKERTMPRRLVLGPSLLMLAACGGRSDSDQDQDLARYLEAVDQANAKEAQARTLGVDTPCRQADQRGVLALLEPTACPASTYKVYSSISSTAGQAKAAADEQVALADHAIAIDPRP
jgi:hypothetical protein